MKGSSTVVKFYGSYDNSLFWEQMTLLETNDVLFLLILDILVVSFLMGMQWEMPSSQ